MRLIIALFALVCGFAFVQSNPLSRIPSDEKLREIKGELAKILKALEIEIPDDIQFPPRVNKMREKLLYQFSLKSENFQNTNIISAPTYCDDGYKLYNGQCRRIFFSLPPNIRQRP